jgi:LPXTG-motif cell wall-anchored protein
MLHRFHIPAVAVSVVCLLLSGCEDNKSPKTNLILNGDAEMPRLDSVPTGWLNIQGNWSSAEGDSGKHDCGYAQSGKYFFFAGTDSLGILRQDIDVSAYAPGIDALEQQFIFNGYAESLDQGPNSDQSQIIITGLDSSKNKALYTFNSDSTRSLNKWLLLTDTFMAPATTRFLRIQLISIRHIGADNDGYFDHLVLTTAAKHSFFARRRLLIVIGLSMLIAGLLIFLKRRKKEARLHSEPL